MEIHSPKTSQIISIQHELVMSIGLDLDLDKTLTSFMHACLRCLQLQSAHIFLFADRDARAKLEHHLSAPTHTQDIPAPDPHAETLSSELRPRQSAQNGRYDLSFSLRDIGVIVLRCEGRALDETVAYSLIPIMERLSISCQACLDHQNILNEINARKQAEATAARQSTMDSLTALPNRKALYLHLQEQLNSRKPSAPSGAVFSIDIDRFRYINDTLGHAVADELLVAVSDILQHCARESDFLARMGSDEFALAIANHGASDTQSVDIAETIANRILDATSRPIDINGFSLSISMSIGIALFPTHIHADQDAKSNAEALVKYADTAMNAAKRQGRDNWAFFDPTMQVHSENRVSIEKQLRHALENNEFEMHYQPIVEPNGKIVGGESLVRWQNAELGFVSPGEFIPIAEETGLIKEIGEWTIRDACDLIKKIVSEKDSNHFSNFQYLSVNVSPRQFKQPSFAKNVIHIVETSAIDPVHLRLEVTEGIAIDNISDTVKKMQLLLDYGIKFSLDDFGTGYSSLAYLHRLPLHTIKIDQSFVTNINEHPENQAIVDATVAMAEHMGKYCIIEGVETLEDLEYFQGIAINAMQGYFFSRPVAKAHFLHLLASGNVFDYCPPESPQDSISEAS